MVLFTMTKYLILVKLEGSTSSMSFNMHHMHIFDTADKKYNTALDIF